MGWRPDPPSIKDYIYMDKPGHGDALNTSVSVGTTTTSVVDYFSDKVLDQGDKGSCVWHGVPQQLRYERHLLGLPDFLPSRLFGYYFTRRQLFLKADGSEQPGWEKIDSGCIIRDAYLILDADGMIPEEEWPYDDGPDQFAVRPPQKLLHEALGNQVDSIGAAVGSTLRYLRIPREEERMYRCLDANHPFTFGFTVYENFDRVGSDGIVTMPGKNDLEYEGHCMLACSRKIKPGYITCLNSWTEWFGEAGFCHMPIDYFLDENLSDDFWTVRPTL